MFCQFSRSSSCTISVSFSNRLVLILINGILDPVLERSGESGVTHDSIRVKVWDRGSFGAISQRARWVWCMTQSGWVWSPSGLNGLHDSTWLLCQLYSFFDDGHVCHDDHGSFVYGSPNLFWGPSDSVRTGLTGALSKPGPRTHLTSLLLFWFLFWERKEVRQRREWKRKR